MRHLYHGTPNTVFDRFRSDRPTYTFVDKAEALALVAQHGGRVLRVDFDGLVATSAQALAVWNAVNEPEPAYLYSMLCFETNEFSLTDIRRFILALSKAGYEAVAHADYSQLDSDEDAQAVCILDASAVSFVELPA